MSRMGVEGRKEEYLSCVSSGRIQQGIPLAYAPPTSIAISAHHEVAYSLDHSMSADGERHG